MHKMPYVLIVDNMPDAADTFATLLERWGYDAEAHYCGSTALAAACKRRPAAVLLDIGMAPMNGFQFVAQLRKCQSCINTAIVIVSGHTTQALQTQARSLGIDHYLVKPANLSLLKAILEELCLAQQSDSLRRNPDRVDAWFPANEFANC